MHISSGRMCAFMNICSPLSMQYSLSGSCHCVQLRLTPEQAQEKEGIETQLSELKEAISLEEDDAKKATLQEELATGQEKLETLMDSVRVRDDLHELCKCSLIKRGPASHARTQ